MKNFTYLFIGILFYLLWSCSTNEKSFHAPFSNLEPEFYSFPVFAEKGDTIYLKSGTQIIVPPNAFALQNNLFAKGWVEVIYREMHTADDIYLTGIPLKYDSANVAHHLQTAGMFEIRAYQDCKPLKMNPCKSCEKNIKIRMASFEDGNNYNFYAFDEEKNNWIYKHPSKSERNLYKEKLLKKIEILEKEIEGLTPKRKFPEDENCFIFDYNAFIDIYSFDPDFKKNIRIAKKYGMIWSNIEVNEYASFNKKRHHAALLVWKNISEKSFPKWASKHIRKRLLQKLEEPNRYLLTIISDDNKKIYTAEIESINLLKNLYSKRVSRLIDEYEKNIKKIEQKKIELEKARQFAEMTASVFRNFKINGFGVFNCDKILEKENFIEILAHFKLSNGQNLKDFQQVNMIIENEKSVITYRCKNGKAKINISPDSQIKFVAVLPDSLIATFSKEKYLNIDFEKLTASSSPNLDINLTSKQFPTDINQVLN